MGITSSKTRSLVGEGHITILPHFCLTNVTGWGYTYASNYYRACAWYHTTNLSYCEYKVYLAKGTYTLKTNTNKGGDRGILKIYIDNVLVATHDTYSAAQALAVIDTTTDIVIAQSGIKTIKIEINGKNASSTGYGMLFNDLNLTRTA